MGELGRQRVAGPRTKASKRSRIEPAAGLVGVDHLAGKRDEVSSVSDHDRVAVKELVELVVDPHRMKRRAVVLQVGCLSGALLVFGRAQLRDPRGGRVFESCGAFADRGQRCADPSVALGCNFARVWTLGLGAVNDEDLRLFAERAAETESEVHRDADDKCHVGALQRLSASPREEEVVVGRDAAARQAVEEDGNPALVNELKQSLLAMPPPKVGAGHDYRPFGLRQQCHGLVDPARRSRLQGCVRELRGSADLFSFGKDDVEREIDERRAAVRGQRRGQSLVDQFGDLAGSLGRAGRLRQWCDERDVVNLLKRTHPPAHRGSTAAEHEDRRLVLQRRPDCTHAVCYAGACGQRGDARLAGDLGPALCSEGRRLLVTGVDDLDSFVAAAVIDREEVSSREREELRDSLLLEPARCEATAVIHRR
uniref:Unannotated protein n=1 Tax=freshwater metagenome TaxID=449393 RepID=A0A6J6A1Q1_9ZZZZ